MAKPTVDSLGKKSDSLNRQYTANFAGQSRHTRDLELLERLIERQGAVLVKAKKLGKPARKIVEIIRERYRMYKAEHVLIAQSQTLGAEDVAMGSASRKIKDIMALYERLFSGQNRLTRPDAFLPVFIADLKEQFKALRLLDPDDVAVHKEQLDAAEGHIELLSGEIREIRNSRSDLERDGYEAVNAEVANTYFRLYQVHFANKSRISRHPPVLAVILTGLEGVAAVFEDLAARGYKSETLEDNRAIVAERLAAYRAESEQLVEAIASIKARDRIGALGADANDVNALYREHFAGKDRATRELSLIRELADRLHFAALEMEAITDAIDGGHPENTKNLQTVRKTLSMYHEEYRQIFEIQQSPGRAAAGTLGGMVRVRQDDR